MAKRLYVGNLPYQVTSEELGRIFSQAGTVVSATVITDRETGRPRGFGFVEMASDQEADAAIGMFEGYTMEGRQLRVSQARDRMEDGGFGGGGGGRGRSQGGRSNRGY